MNDVQEAKLSMYVAVRDYLGLNAAVVTPLPSFTAFNTSFNGFVDQVQGVRAQQETIRTGVAASKEQARKLLVTQAVDISRRIAAYAQVINNPVLLAEVSYTLSDLNKSTDTVLRDRCEIIRQRAASNQTAVQPYGLTAAMVTALQTQIGTFLTAIPKPKAAIADRKMTTNKLKLLFDQADDVLKNKIDVLVETLRISNADFYNGYRNARTIVNEHPTQKLAVRVRVSDKATGLPLPMVTASIQGRKKSKTTTAKGNFIIQALPAGSYTINFSKNGYAPVAAVVNVNDGETTDVAVTMEAV